MYTITDEGKKFLEDNVDQDAFTKRLEQFKNVDFEELKAVREQMQTLFHEFMKASQQTLQDDKKKAEFDVFIQETKERLQQFYK